MSKACFFCDVQNRQSDDHRIKANHLFSARFSDFPVSKGHCEIFPKKHIDSFFDLGAEELSSFFELIKQVKNIIDDKYHPDGYNIGVNEGEAAGRSIHHVHIHLIPRYRGDVPNPRGGIRNIFPSKADYIPEIQNNPEYKDNIKYI